MIVRRLFYISQILQNQWRPPEDIEKMQLKRLKFIVSHAYRTTQLYHRKFKKAGIHPSDIKSLKDLQKIPLTTKEEMRNTKQVMSTQYTFKNTVNYTTTGSTGKKLEIYYNKSANDRYFTFNFRHVFSVGMKPWYVYAPIIHHGNHEKWQLATFSFLYPMPCNLDEKTMLSLLNKKKPDALGGHPCTLFLIAKQAETHGYTFSPKFVLLGGEVSTPEERKYIETVFNCPTYNKYGSMELRQIARECTYNNMHIDADNNIMEFIKDGEPVNPGEEGEVVGTNLWNEAMPFIRYRQNDIGSPSNDVCPCGRGLPLISQLQGRRDDFIVVGDKIIPPTRIVPLFFPLQNIIAFQVVQDASDHITIKIKGEITPDTETTLVKKMKLAIGTPVEVTVQKCDIIQEDKKSLRAVISKVKK
jgi:phenylacetate-CoA ligase